ncbi:hypothetical protein [Corallococcus exercitus]|uniref:hypothetical protein n=1 Tax=Corallococcus exercitus TaxID=2316736 RepID=UPI0034633DC8
MGLFISKQIIAAHGGRISVEGPPDGGACFVVLLPRSAAHTQAPGVLTLSGVLG